MNMFKLRPPGWRRIRLPFKLPLVYMPLILLPALAGIYILTDSYTASSKARTAEYATDLLALMAQKIDDRLGSYEQLSKQIMTDDELLSRLAVKPASVYERFEIQNAINERLNVFWLGSDQNAYIRAIKLTTPDAEYTYGTDAIDGFGADDADYQARVAEMKGGAVWFRPEAYSDGYASFDALRLGRSIRDKKLSALGTLTIVIRTDAVTDIFSQTKFRENAAIRLLTGKGEEILGNGKTAQAGERQLLTYSRDSIRNGWQLSAQLPLNQLYEPIYRTARMATFIVLGCIVLGLVLTQLLVIDLVIPIRRLMVNMKQGIKGVRPGRLKRFGGAIEIVEMNDTFISVMYEIERLIEEASRQERQKKEAEIRVLQNQLSPHFLHNTLNSIRWMAMIQKQDNIKETVDSLNRLLTYALRGGGGPVPLGTEVEMLRSYVTIQKVRYQHFGFESRVPQALEAALVPKFLLQPLIENALLHGLADADRPGEISVEAATAGRTLVLTVSDNGVGMSPERHAAVVASLDGGDGRSRPEEGGARIGLRSVHERVQLHYGAQYGLRVASAPGEGATLTIRLPLQREEGGEADAQRHDRG
ncbi:sensor histidine kinase [Cohnella sp. GCM10012308]|uniref:cache domain-containing sensor histidine kinase n=1 Tax=Cohnella sp. GCM10012308 TaxID=3317329 RepID=UPI00361F6485